MCMEVSCSPSRSTGETSATNNHASPAAQAGARQPLAARAPPCLRARTQRTP